MNIAARCALLGEGSRRANLSAAEGPDNEEVLTKGTKEEAQRTRRDRVAATQAFIL
jgi:hypothetical protein